MSAVRGCDIPEDLYYLIDKHVWARREGDLVVVGLTDVAQNMARSIISVTVKKTGKKLAKGKSVGTVESSKWVGPVPVPVAGEIVETNDALKSDPTLLNRSPYGDGWIAKIAPDDWDTDSVDLETGREGVAAYEAFLEAEGIVCDDEGGD
ncbi:glycine cleavage system protein GcvH [Paraconexibacter sp.]|uniref:glycine cleavage system protein GcvH n=1 Tax=Paraconexibacter sp. TaxID=2949640 RepID=UPI0035649B62